MMEKYKYTISALFIFTCIGLDLWYGKKNNKSDYRFNDSISDLSNFFAAQLFTIFLVPVTFFLYEIIQTKWSLFKFNTNNYWHWALCLLFVDLSFYIMHRCAHQFNLIWLLHATHHQSEEFNLAVGCRKAMISKIGTIIFYAPLPLLGFPTVMIMACIMIDAFYQFIMHVRWVPKLGPFEWILCTPSIHRVHHGVNTLTKNHGGILVIWDRMFGTFLEEKKEPTYGVRNQLNSWSLVKANIYPWQVIGSQMGQTQGFFNKIKILFSHPEESNKDLGVKFTLSNWNKYIGKEHPAKRKIYIFLQFSLITIASLYLLDQQVSMLSNNFWPLIAYAILSFISLCFFIEGKSGDSVTEGVRHIILIALIWILLPKFLIVGTIYAIFSLLHLFLLR